MTMPDNDYDTQEEAGRGGVAVLMKDVSPSFGPEQQRLADRLFWSFEQTMDRHYDEVETVYATFCDGAEFPDADGFYGEQEEHGGTFPRSALEQVAGRAWSEHDLDASDTYVLMVGDAGYGDQPEAVLGALSPDVTAHITVAGREGSLHDRLDDGWTYDAVVADAADAIAVANEFADVVEETYATKLTDQD